MITLLLTMLFIITLHDGLDLVNCIYVPLITLAFWLDYNDDGEDAEFYTGY